MNPLPGAITVLFHDVDGCLNPEDGSQFVSGEDHRRLTSQQRGMLKQISAAIDASSIEHVILHTGRRLMDTLFIAEELATSKLRYLLSETGAIAYDLIQDAPIDLVAVAEESNRPELAAPFEDVSEVQELIHWYNSGGEQLLADEIGSPIRQIPKETLLTLHVPEAATGASFVDDLKRVLRKQTSIEQGRLRFYYNEFHVDIASAIDKGTGAQILLQMLDVPASAAAMIGDGTNDVPAFEVCGHGFCPSNSDERLKAVCRAMGGVVLEESFGAASIEVFRRLTA
jgi:hydroxymethylpyrimidine pyrophosphatase-like HAD family hydrolase